MSTDSGVFAYCGQQMLQGGLLYRDCWDNKPPLVYALNALAIALGGNTPESIWLFQASWITLTGFVFYLVLRRIWGHRLAFFITFFFLATLLYPSYYQGGNLTETYVLLPLILMMGAFYHYLSTGKRLDLVWIGFLAALAFLLKPTYLAISLATGLTVLYLDASRRKLRLLLEHALLLLVSAGLPLIVTAVYFAIQGAFRDFWFAVFEHNFLYTQAGFTRHSLVGSFQLYFLLKPMAAAVSVAFVSACVFVIDHAHKLLPKSWSTAEKHPAFTPGQMSVEDAQGWHMLSLLLSIPLDFALFAMSGKNFGHYLVVPLPALTACGAYAISVLYKFGHTVSAERAGSLARSVFIIALAALAYLYAQWFFAVAEAEIPEPGKLPAFLKSPDILAHQPTELEQYILDHSGPEQAVLVWSSDPYLNFVTGRRSPTRYIFPLHLLTPTLTGSTGFGELIEELQEDPPVLIAAQPNPASAMPFFEGNGDQFCPGCSAEVSQGLLDLRNYLESHYTFDRQVWDWYLYLPSP
jgi:4-amino-4-deoxy-L-arabinose transferase-like glycosyltransferase